MSEGMANPHKVSCAGLRLFLRPIGKCGEGLLDFFHRQLAKAIARRYGSKEHNIEMHDRLASYFMAKLGVSSSSWEWNGQYSRAVSELPYHLTLAHRWYVDPSPT